MEDDLLELLAEEEIFNQFSTSYNNVSIVTGKMVALLNQFEVSLTSLEGTILPIHKSTKRQTTLENNLKESIDKTDIFISHLDTSELSENQIMRDSLAFLSASKLSCADRQIQSLVDSLSEVWGSLFLSSGR
jgi:hypothetical protein